MQSYFVYSPISGDKVFAERATQQITWIKCNNGSRHVIGGQMLEYNTVEPRNNYRQAAREVCTLLVNRYGGVAWDLMGMVRIIVPVEHALTCHQYVMGCSHTNNKRGSLLVDPNEIGLLGAGYSADDNLRPIGTDKVSPRIVDLTYGLHNGKYTVFALIEEKKGVRREVTVCRIPEKWGPLETRLVKSS